jgi:hypothetical protein
MAEVNTSIYAPNPANQPLNPLQALTAIGQINQSRLFEQTYNARDAIGKAYQRNVNPDGTINSPGLIRDIGAGGGFLAGEATGTALSNTGTQFDVQGKQIQFVRDGLGALADKPNLTKTDLQHYIVRAARNTNVPTEMLHSFVENAPDDPKKLREYVVTQRNLALGSAGAATPTAGPPTAAGEPTSITTGQAGYERAGVGVQPRGTGGVAPSANPSAQRPIGMVTGLPPGAEKSATIYYDDLAHARNYGQEVVPWQQALDKMNELKAKYGSGYLGPGTKGRQEFQSFAFSLAPTLARWAGVDPTKLKDYAQIEKYLTQATQARASSFGANTDLGLRTAITGNPSIHINDMAAEDVTKMALALRRMEQVQTLQNAPHGQVQYAAETAKWATKQDPRAYAIDLMPPEQVKKLQKELKGREREKFNASLRAAIESGVIIPPNMGAGGTNAPP